MDTNLEPVPAQTFDPEAILAEYQHRKMVESMIGPIISLVLHVLLMGSVLLFYEADATVTQASIELEMKELEVKELDQKELEKLEKLEEIAEEAVPTVERPDIISDAQVTDVVSSSVSDFSDRLASTDDAMNFSDVLDIRAMTRR